MARLTAFVSALLLLLSLLCNSLALAPNQHTRQQQQINTGPNDVYIRPATESDLDDITTVLIDAFAPNAANRYIYTKLDQYRKYNWRCTRKEIGKAFAKLPDNGFINVISVQNLHAPGLENARKPDRVVAVAAWVVMEPQAGIFEYENTWLPNTYRMTAKCSDHLQLNKTRAIHYLRQMDAAQKKYVYDYPHTQMYLDTLATHPDWDGHGFGAAHVHWGLERAKSMDIPTTLLATPAGYVLYDSLGFESVANITIRTLDWPEDVWFEYMRYEMSDHGTLHDKIEYTFVLCEIRVFEMLYEAWRLVPYMHDIWPLKFEAAVNMSITSE